MPVPTGPTTSAFRWTDGGGTLRSHVTDRVTVDPVVDGASYTVVGAAGLETRTEVRAVRLAVEVETRIGPGEEYTLPRIWLDLLKGEDVEFWPLLARADLAFAVQPDLGHSGTLFAFAL